MTTRYDGYVNTVIGHGLANKDPMANFLFKAAPMLADNMLTQLFMNAIARKIVSLPADEAVKNWITVEGDTENLAVQTLDDLGAESQFADALRWARLYGGSVILLLADDGGELDDELREDKLQTIEELRVYDKTQVFWNDAVLYEDPRNKQYGKPQYYQISPIGGMPFLVHESRLLIFKGDPIPEYYRLLYQGWGLPALQGMMDELRNNSHSYQLALLIMERMGQSVLKLNGMLDKLEEEDGEEQIKKRLALIDLARSVMNTIAIDKEDEFDIKNMSLTSIPDLIDRFGLALSASCNIPFTLLFGRSPAGMNATGQSDLENFYSWIGQIQRRQLKPQLDKLTRLIMMCQKGLFRGKQPEQWSVKCNPLWVPSDKEQAETENQKAAAKSQKAQEMNTKLQNRVISRAEWQRKEGYTAEEIATINQEIQGESNGDLGDLLGHSFGGAS